MTSDEIKSNLKVSSNCVILEALEYINELETEIESITGKFDCQQQVYADLSKIIKNQKTEIDGLKSRNINNCRHWQKKYSSLKADAIKEFGKFLIDKSENGVISISDIVDYVIEMVGENNGI